MKTKTILIQNNPMAIFSKGSDLFKLKVLRYICSKDQYECFYLNDLKKKFKVSRGKIYKVMVSLEKEKKIKKFKSYPVFWKREI